MYFSGDVKGIVGEGMPLPKSPFEHGNMYIKFDVTFPPNQFADPEKLKVCIFFPSSIQSSFSSLCSHKSRCCFNEHNM